MEGKSITECSICGREMEYNKKDFEDGPTGEPVCEDCIEEVMEDD